MIQELEADIKLVREVLMSRSDDGTKFGGPHLIGWHEAIEALARIEKRILELKSKETNDRS